MDGSVPPAHWLRASLADRKAELEARIATERARAVPDEALIRRLTREKLLARDRIAALAGSGMPAWARAGGSTAE